MITNTNNVNSNNQNYKVNQVEKINQITNTNFNLNPNSLLDDLNKNENNPTVFLNVLVHDREWILPTFLKHVSNLDYNKKNIEILFIINNSTDKSYDILKNFQSTYNSEYKNITIDVYNNKKICKDERTSEIREKIIYNWLSELRNRGIEKFLKTDNDLYFNVDSDILVTPDCLKNLISHNEYYISALIYNGYLYKNQSEIINESKKISNIVLQHKYINEQNDKFKKFGNIEEAYKFPNILRKNSYNTYTHVVNNYVKYPNKNLNKKISVDFTGAIFLVKRVVLQNKNNRFGWEKQGEDQYFCENIIKSGYKLYCAITFNYHIMSQLMLELYNEGKLNPELY